MAVIVLGLIALGVGVFALLIYIVCLEYVLWRARRRLRKEVEVSREG